MRFIVQVQGHPVEIATGVDMFSAVLRVAERIWRENGSADDHVMSVAACELSETGVLFRFSVRPEVTLVVRDEVHPNE